MQHIELLYRMCQFLRCDFCRSTREGYKLHSLLGSVGKRAETNFNFPAPPFNHIFGICKNLADTWPAATWVFSRGRKREDPGNEVDALLCHHHPIIVYHASSLTNHRTENFITPTDTTCGHSSNLPLLLARPLWTNRDFFWYTDILYIYIYARTTMMPPRRGQNPCGATTLSYFILVSDGFHLVNWKSGTMKD